VIRLALVFALLLPTTAAAAVPPALGPLERLSRPRARRAMRRYERRARLGGALRIDLRRCGRAGAKAFACQAVQVERRRRGPDREQCVGVWTVRLRPDGFRSLTREAPAACRRLGPVR
jgi:hypothetical protein